MSDGLSEHNGEKDQAQTAAPTGTGAGEPQQPATAGAPTPAATGQEDRRQAPEVPAPGATGPDNAQPAPGASAVAPSAASNGRGFLWGARQFFWMEQRLASAKKEGYAPGDPGWPEFDLARGGLADATQLGESGEGQGSALLLYRASAALLVRAQLARAGISMAPTASNEECWARLVELPIGATQQAALTGEQATLVAGALGSQGESCLAQLSKDKRLPVARALAKVAQGLGDPLEADAKRVGRVLISRWLRTGLTAFVLIVGGWLLLSKLTDTPNLALHKPVTVATPHPTYGRDPSLLVDGDLTNMGFHTTEAANSNVTIDLGGVYSISRVVVHNRTDCCQDRAVPLKIEVSEDNKTFKQVAERAEVFDRWTAKFSSVSARYVKLTDTKNSAFHLAEVEVY